MAKNERDELFVKSNTKRDGTKHHKTGFTEAEDIQNKRHQKIHFKNYIKQQREDAGLDELDELDEDLAADIKRLMR